MIHTYPSGAPRSKNRDPYVSGGIQGWQPLAGVAGSAREQQSPERLRASGDEGLPMFEDRAQQNTPAKPGSQQADRRAAATGEAGERRSRDVRLGRKPSTPEQVACPGSPP